ncbi:MAG: flagellar motor switch protein FliN [Chloroflexi bacterium]|nr:flagellar motor switch protein FliN [Chloroflexota bacterium]
MAPDLEDEEFLTDDGPLPADFPARQPQPLPLERPPADPEPREPVSVRPVQFAPFASRNTPKVSDEANLDLLMDVDMRVTVELGRTEKPIREILQMGPGSIVALDKLAGEPVDVKVNGVLIAYGEIVVVDEKFGVRLTQILSAARRAGS